MEISQDRFEKFPESCNPVSLDLRLRRTFSLGNCRPLRFLTSKVLLGGTHRSFESCGVGEVSPASVVTQQLLLFPLETGIPPSEVRSPAPSQHNFAPSLYTSTHRKPSEVFRWKNKQDEYMRHLD